MYKFLFYLSTVAVVSIILMPAARADDAYVCDGGRLAYARPETLEKLKHTDPCIAKYYAYPTAAPALASATPAPVSPIAAKPDPTVPRGTDRKPVVPRPAPDLKNDTALRLAPSFAATAPALSVPVTAPSAAPGTDYRNVRIINAPTSATEIFRHER